MKAKKFGAAALLAAALVMPLSACANSSDSGNGGGDKLSKDEACSQVKTAIEDLQKQAPPTAADQAMTMFSDLTGKLDDIAAKSPDEVKARIEKVNELFKNVASNPASMNSSDMTTVGQDLQNACPDLANIGK